MTLMCHLLLSISCIFFFHFSNLFDCPISFTCLLSLSLSSSLSVCVSFFPHVSPAFSLFSCFYCVHCLCPHIILVCLVFCVITILCPIGTPTPRHDRAKQMGRAKREGQGDWATMCSCKKEENSTGNL